MKNTLLISLGVLLALSSPVGAQSLTRQLQNEGAASLAKDARKRGSNAREWMPPRRIKDNAAQRYDKHVAGIDRRVRNDSDQDDHWG